MGQSREGRGRVKQNKKTFTILSHLRLLGKERRKREEKNRARREMIS
jgi:hypothetical protein